MYMTLMIMIPFIILMLTLFFLRLHVVQEEYGCEDYCNSNEEKYAPPDDEPNHKHVPAKTVTPTTTEATTGSTIIVVVDGTTEAPPLTNCLKEDNFPHPFVASLFQAFYIWDDVAKKKSTDVYQKFLCAGAIISRRHVLASYECFQIDINKVRHLTKFVFVSVGSRKWNDGLKYEIEKLTTSPEINGFSPLVMATLKRDLLRAHSINVIKASTLKLTERLYNSFGWERSEKYVRDVENQEGVAKRQTRMLDVEECHMFTGVEKISCGKDNMEGLLCKKFVGSLIVMDERLHGVRVAHECTQGTGNVEERFYFADVSAFKEWIFKYQPKK